MRHRYIEMRQPYCGHAPRICRTSGSGNIGKLWVAENRSKNNGRLIQLAFVRLKTTAANPQPPIVFLAGGPGYLEQAWGAYLCISICSPDYKKSPT